MAKNLALKSTAPVYIYDINEAVVARATKAYPQLLPARDPTELSEKASTLLTMLPESRHVEAIYDQLYLDEHTRWIDSSTIDTSVARALAKKVHDRYPGARGAKAFDAPVSGGIVGADKGSLTFMVGAPSEDDFQSIQPVLQLMGSRAIYCGANGAGQVAKICNNMLLAIHMIGVSEAMRLGTQLGMDAALLASVINASTGRCWSSEINNPYPGVVSTAPASRDYQGGFSNTLMAKDLSLAMKAAHHALGQDNHRPFLGSQAADLYQRLATDKDFATLDFSSVYKVNLHTQWE
ncbi:3-hydroxyisobutyrate dehydrogenase [Mycotypha africana]|uniref:3-hydroxyisobutyrate dehydrogenase n=1 Tax=Mycotypha africana TaxID=64632 RepID=UPI0023019C9D|nr:3-hydroxyisobutyrate dehydrogenase [Mycotypha africana]KAI8981936.1 3-hydroxyisobutyrate dehydrogenase [Mycotypha africana]